MDTTNKYLKLDELVFIRHPNDARFLDLTDKTFNLLTVLGLSKTVSRLKYWACRCTCGNVVAVQGRHLKDGRTKSCGCLRQLTGRTNPRKHGMSRTPTYNSWFSMIDRCANSDLPRNKNYAGRGISVCNRWLNSFDNFFADMGERPNGMTLERKNNDLGYSPDNCEWADKIKQANNRRTNVFVEMGGERKTIPNWCRQYGLDGEREFERVRKQLKNGKSLESILGL